MLEGITIGIVVGITMLIINTIIHRANVMTRTDRIENDIEDLKEGQATILKSLIAILVALRDGKTNGECADALHSINEYLTNSIKK